MTADERSTASNVIADAFIKSREFHASQNIACYLAAWDEVETSRIIARAWSVNKRVFAPVVMRNHRMRFYELAQETVLEQNQYGLWQPRQGPVIAAQHLDIVITPLVAFDSSCNRIGMGSGYFDRRFAFLKHRRFWFRPKLIGLAFDCQRVEKIPANPWDIPLYSVYTESSRRRQ